MTEVRVFGDIDSLRRRPRTPHTERPAGGVPFPRGPTRYLSPLQASAMVERAGIQYSDKHRHAQTKPRQEA